jgi:hypothetical protein
VLQTQIDSIAKKKLEEKLCSEPRDSQFCRHSTFALHDGAIRRNNIPDHSSESKHCCYANINRLSLLVLVCLNQTEYRVVDIKLLDSCVDWAPAFVVRKPLLSYNCCQFRTLKAIQESLTK